MGAIIKDEQLLIAAGLNANGTPKKCDTGCSAQKTNIKMFFRIIDEQDAVNRYVWYNLPCNMTSQEVERLLYYKGQLVFFYFPERDTFYFMPYALDGTIDFYGRYNRVHPVPMSSGMDEKDNDMKEAVANQAALLSMLKLNCVYGVQMPEDVNIDTILTSGVLLHDYTKQLSQTIIPRQFVNDGILDAMADCVPYMSTSLLAGTGTKAVRVADADQQDQVNQASKDMDRNALSKKPLVAVIGKMEMQDLLSNPSNKAQDYLLALQGLDNIRLSAYGLENGGIFQKKAHKLQSETINASVGNVLQDGLSIRQNFCNIVNSIWGLSIWCEPSEVSSDGDLNGDGNIYDRNDGGEHSGVDTMESEDQQDER